MIRRPLFVPLAVVLLVVFIAAASRAAVVPPDGAELFQQVDALTAPEMEGRRAGTPGGDRAARYLADRLAAMGLTPGGDAGTYFQTFVVAPGMAVAPDSALERLGAEPRAFQLPQEWSPHGGSASGEISGEIVFVGYGLSVADRGWDDYAGVNVQDRIALILDGTPEHRPDLRSSRLEKLRLARRHGARGALIVTESLPSLAATQAAVKLPSGAITPLAADRLLERSGKTTAALRAAMTSARTPQSFATGVEARMRVSLAREDRRTANVIGILPGTDPLRASEAVVLGAHYDHLGRVGDAVHPGADDNASGTAVVLGLAQAFAKAGATPRTLVFVLFGGEEAGLLGSTYYVGHPTVPLDRTVAMLNFDMVGRLRDRHLNVSGVGSGSGFRALVTAASPVDSLDLALHDTPFAPSDHTAFYGAGVPVLFFYTGGHDDYHTPRDTADKINATGMAQIAAIAARVVGQLAVEARPSYVKLSRPPAASRGSGASGGAFLGISADGGDESDGLRIASVLSDTGAARAGLKTGDVIVRLDDQPINRFEDLKQVVDGKRPGDTVSVLYLREGEDHVTTATLGPRP